MAHCKETGKCDPYTGRKSRQWNYWWEYPDTGFNKEFKAAFRGMLKELKEMILKQVKDSMMAMSHHIENTNKEI